MSKLSIEYNSLSDSNELWEIDHINKDLDNLTVILGTENHQIISINSNGNGHTAIFLNKKKKINLDCFELQQLKVLLQAQDSLHKLDQSFELYELGEKKKFGG